MKTLTKNTLLLIIILLISCNKDDSSDDTNLDNLELIVGDWQLNKRFFNAENGNVTEIELDACDTFTTITFNDDFTYIYILRSGDNCETNNDQTGQYEFIDENRIQLDGSSSRRYTIRGDFLDARYSESFISEEFIKL